VIESPLQSPDATRFVAAIEENLFALAPLFRHLPGAESGAGPEGRWTVTDVAFPFFNSILGTDVDAAGADATIERALTRARRRRVPVLWWTGPRTRPRDLGARLERHGFARDDEAPGMALELVRLPAADPPPPELTVERVESGAALADFVATFRLGFGIDAAFERPWVNWLATLGLGDGAPMRHYLARWAGEPVAPRRCCSPRAWPASITSRRCRRPAAAASAPRPRGPRSPPRATATAALGRSSTPRRWACASTRPRLREYCRNRRLLLDGLRGRPPPAVR